MKNKTNNNMNYMMKQLKMMKNMKMNNNKDILTKICITIN